MFIVKYTAVDGIVEEVQVDSFKEVEAIFEGLVHQKSMTVRCATFDERIDFGGFPAPQEKSLL
jgi:hypothetical protein